MKRVLIVGRNSYIGNSVEAWLHSRPETYLVKKISVRNDDWKAVDLKQFDAILYLAGLVHVKEKKELWPEYLRLNAELPYEFAEYAKASGVPHFLFFSTKGVYKPNTEHIDKETEPNPVKLYGKSKLIGEKRILSLKDDSFRVSVLRPPVVYGEGCKGNFPKLVRLSERIHLFPKLFNHRSMIYIWNLCEFVRLMIEDPVSDTIVFPQDKELVGVTDIITMLWKEKNERYYLSATLAFVVKVMIKLKLFGALNTMFMDTVYDPEESSYYNNSYCIFSHEEAIKKILITSKTV